MRERVRVVRIDCGAKRCFGFVKISEKQLGLADRRLLIRRTAATPGGHCNGDKEYQRDANHGAYS
jgi:hypothetical protein